MAGSTFGTNFKIMTWGESHGPALGVTIDGCPAGLSLAVSDIRKFLNRRKPGQSDITTSRQEDDEVTILSGVFAGVTTGAPISLMVKNTAQRSADYTEIANYYRPGHADFTFETKYGFRDYRGGGRSSGRETVSRVAAGAVAVKILNELGVNFLSYTHSIGIVGIDKAKFDPALIGKTKTLMPDEEADREALKLISACLERHDSIGGVVECRINGLPPGIGEPVFSKLDALLSHAIMSIGAVKAVEIGAGTGAALAYGSENNDEFIYTNASIRKRTNHSGGILGGISDGDEIILRAHIKPTPSIAQTQLTVDKSGQEIPVNIKGRHDPIIVPRAVVVVEAMAALTVLDLMMINMSSRLDRLIDFYC